MSTTEGPSGAPSAENDTLAETLTHALHGTETAQGWYGAPECEEVGQALAPHVQALLAEAWDDGYDGGHQDARAVQPTYPWRTENPYRVHYARKGRR